MSYFYIFLTIAFTVYGQIVLKWQVIGAGEFPATAWDKIPFLARLILNPWVISGFFFGVSCFAGMDGSDDKAGSEPCLPIHESQFRIRHHLEQPFIS